MVGPQGQSYFVNFLRQDNVFVDPITNNLSPSNPAFPYTSTFKALILALLGLGVWRVILTAATTFFYDPVSGNDANNGLTSGTAKRTLANIWSTIATQYDLAGNTVTIQTVGTPTITETMRPLAWVGGGQVIFDGNGASWNAPNDAIDAFNNLPGPLTLQRITIAAAGDCIFIAAFATIFIGTNVIFGVCGARHMACTRPGAVIQALSPGYSITGAAAWAHMWVDTGGTILNRVSVNVAGGLAFGNSQSFAFVSAFEISVIACNGIVFSGAGAPDGGSPATGRKFVCDSGACIFTGGAGVNLFPGNVTPSPPTTNGGIYV